MFDSSKDFKKGPLLRICHDQRATIPKSFYMMRLEKIT